MLYNIGRSGWCMFIYDSNTGIVRLERCNDELPEYDNLSGVSNKLRMIGEKIPICKYSVRYDSDYSVLYSLHIEYSNDNWIVKFICNSEHAYVFKKGASSISFMLYHTGGNIFNISMKIPALMAQYLYGLYCKRDFFEIRRAFGDWFMKDSADLYTNVVRVLDMRFDCWF